LTGTMKVSVLLPLPPPLLAPLPAPADQSVIYR
jgi:hypothetical protein